MFLSKSSRVLRRLVVAELKPNVRQFCAAKERNFNVLGIQQIAIGGLNKQVVTSRRHLMDCNYKIIICSSSFEQDLAHFWGDLLGLSRTGVYKAQVSRYHCQPHEKIIKNE